jgi:Glycosyltransferase family 9 (heptosyltransferase)
MKSTSSRVLISKVVGNASMIVTPMSRLVRLARKPTQEKLLAIRAKLGTVVSPAAWLAVYRFLRAGLPHRVLFHGLTPGDDLMCTAIFEELRLRCLNKSVTMVSNFPDLFRGLLSPTSVLPAGDSYSWGERPLSVYGRLARMVGGELVQLFYSRFDGHDQSEPPTRHYIAELCASAGITGPISLKPHLAVSEQEISAAAWARSRIVIQSSGTGARNPMRNKEWFPERYQAVVDALRAEWQFVQMGSPKDPPLNHVLDLRGATSIRESAAILYNARLNVGYVGFLMHLARAVECPSVIVYGGREAPWQSGYVCNFNLYNAVPCAPCWRNNFCDFDRKCMREISVEHAICAIKEMLERPRNPLTVETVSV